MKKLIIAATLAAATTFGAVAAHASAAWVSSGITLNARSGPGTNYGVIGKFTPCTEVHVVSWQHGWAKVSYQHNQYWVSGKYLQTHACETYHNNNTYNNNHNTNTGGTYKKNY